MKTETYQQKQQQLIAEKQAMEDIIQSGGSCLLCGYGEDPRILEQHHVAGRKNSDITITVCPNCHRKLSQKQYAWPEEWTQDANGTLKRIAFLLQGFAELLILIAVTLLEIVSELLNYGRDSTE